MRKFIAWPKASFLIEAFRYFLSLTTILVLPIIMQQANSVWLRYTSTKENAIFEYFGFVGFIVIGINAWILVKRNQPFVLANHFHRLGFAFFAVFQLIVFSEFSKRNYDYMAYENAAKLLLAGKSPYEAYPNYIYPPLLVQSFAYLFKGLNGFWAVFLHQALAEQAIYDLIFFIYQTIQYFLTLACYLLSYAFARALNLNRRSAVLLVTLLFVVNDPLYRNFAFNQVNLWILLSLLVALLAAQRWPFWAGVAIAVGTHIKLYPITQVLPWLLSRNRRAIAGCLVGLAAIFAILTKGGTKLTLWISFVSYIQDVQKGQALRNNSLTSFASNLSQLFFSGSPLQQFVSSLIFILLTGAGVIWIALRIWQRMRLPGLSPLDLYLGNAMDCIFLMFVISPSVWEHHYVMLLPVVLWACARAPQRVLGMVGLGAALIYLVPTFDVFFFSYVRLLGVILLLIATSPKKLQMLACQEIDLFSYVSNQAI